MSNIATQEMISNEIKRRCDMIASKFKRFDDIPEFKFLESAFFATLTDEEQTQIKDGNRISGHTPVDQRAFADELYKSVLLFVTKRGDINTDIAEELLQPMEDALGLRSDVPLNMFERDTPEYNKIKSTLHAFTQMINSMSPSQFRAMQKHVEKEYERDEETYTSDDVRALIFNKVEVAKKKVIGWVIRLIDHGREAEALKLMKSLTSWVRENSTQGDDVINVTADSPEGGPLDKYAFFDRRKDNKIKAAREAGIEEEDNPTEDYIFTVLQHHISDNEDLSKREINAIKMLVKDERYSEIFRETKANEIMRGITVSIETLEKLLGVRSTTIKMGEKNKIDAIVAGMRGKQNTSWTVDHQQAKNFATNDGNVSESSDDIPIIIYANPQDSADTTFVEFRNAIYKIRGLDNYKYEQEVMALGSVRINAIEVVRMYVDRITPYVFSFIPNDELIKSVRQILLDRGEDESEYDARYERNIYKALVGSGVILDEETLHSIYVIDKDPEVLVDMIIDAWTTRTGGLASSADEFNKMYEEYERKFKES